MIKPSAVTAALTAVALSGCISVSTPLAPGAEQVRVTREPRDVVNCKALGNLDLAQGSAGLNNAKNHAIGMGGDTVLDTTPKSGGMTYPTSTGVIYRCASAVAST
jgi:hypothetical protein